MLPHSASEVEGQPLEAEACVAEGAGGNGQTMARAVGFQFACSLPWKQLSGHYW